MVRCSDRYLADQYLRRERRKGRAYAAWPEQSALQDSATVWVQHHTEAPEAWIGTGTGPDCRRAGAGCGHPMSGDRLEDIPQSVRDPFHSAQEDQGDSSPESLPDDSDEESDDIVVYDTATSRYTTRTERDRRERRDNRLAQRRHHRERRHGLNGRCKKLNLPIFRDSSSDNAITYDDWRSEVDNYVREGHSHQLIRDSVLSALEGRPRHTAKAAMVDGDGSLKSIMSALDQVYGGATTYTTLLNKLNSIQQGYAEPAKDYYERVLQIRVKLQEFHAYMFRRGDLERQTKEAFFNGLKPEYQAMVVHKKDNPTVGTTDLLSAVRECEENQENNRRNRRANYAKTYPPSASRPSYRDHRDNARAPPASPGPDRYRRDNRHADRNVPIRAAQVEPEHPYDHGGRGDYLPDYADYDQGLDQDDVDLTFTTDMWAIATERADGLERKTGKCFNCQDVGHYWRECPKPLKEDFKCLRDQPKRRQEELNGKGGPGKGGRVPQNVNGKPQAPAKVPVTQAPQ